MSSESIYVYNPHITQDTDKCNIIIFLKHESVISEVLYEIHWTVCLIAIILSGSPTYYPTPNPK